MTRAAPAVEARFDVEVAVLVLVFELADDVEVIVNVLQPVVVNSSTLHVVANDVA